MKRRRAIDIGDGSDEIKILPIDNVLDHAFISIDCDYPSLEKYRPQCLQTAKIVSLSGSQISSYACDRIVKSVEKALQESEVKPEKENRRKVKRPLTNHEVKLSGKIAFEQFLYSSEIVCIDEESSWNQEMLYEVLMDTMQMHSSEIGDQLNTEYLHDLLGRMSKRIMARIDDQGSVRTSSLNIAMRIVLNILLIPNLNFETVCDDVLELVYKFALLLSMPHRIQDGTNDRNVFYDNAPDPNATAPIIDEMSRAIEVIDVPQHISVSITKAAIHYSLYGSYTSCVQSLIRVLKKYGHIRTYVLELFLEKAYDPSLVSNFKLSSKRSDLDNSGFMKIALDRYSTIKSISPSTGLLLIIIQACANGPKLCKTKTAQIVEFGDDNAMENALNVVIIAFSKMCVSLLNRPGQRCMLEQLIKDLSQMLYRQQYPISDLLSNYLSRTLFYHCTHSPIDQSGTVFCINQIKVLLHEELRHRQFEAVGSEDSTKSDELSDFWRLFGHFFLLSKDSADALMNANAFNAFCDRHKIRIKKEISKATEIECKMNNDDVTSLLVSIRGAIPIEDGIEFLGRIYEDEKSSKESKVAVIRAITSLVSIGASIMDQPAFKCVLMKSLDSQIIVVRGVAIQLLLAVLRATVDSEIEAEYWPLLCLNILDPSIIIRQSVSNNLSLLIKEKREMGKHLLVPSEIIAGLLDKIHDKDGLSFKKMDRSFLSDLLANILRQTWFNFNHESEDDVFNSIENMVTTIELVGVERLSILRKLILIALRDHYSRHCEVLNAIVSYCCSQCVYAQRLLYFTWIIDVICELMPEIGLKHLNSLVEVINRLKLEFTDLSNTILSCVLSTIRQIIYEINSIPNLKHLEDLLLVLVMTQSFVIMEKSIACLSVAIKPVDAFIQTLLDRMFKIIQDFRVEQSLEKYQPLQVSTFTRSACVLCLFYKYFDGLDFKSKAGKNNLTIDDLFDTLSNAVNDRSVPTFNRCRILQSIGCISHRSASLNRFKLKISELYTQILKENNYQLISQVIRNINESCKFLSKERIDPLGLPPISIKQEPLTNVNGIVIASEVDGQYVLEDMSSSTIGQIDLSILTHLYMTPHPELRIEVIELMTWTTIQRLIHPDMFFPFAISGIADNNLDVRRICRRMLKSYTKMGSLSALIKHLKRAIEILAEISLTEDIGNFSFLIDLFRDEGGRKMKKNLTMVYNKFVDIICDDQSPVSVQLIAAENLSYVSPKDELLSPAIKRLLEYFVEHTVDVLTRLETLIDSRPEYMESSLLEDHSLSHSSLEGLSSKEDRNLLKDLLLRSVRLNIVFDLVQRFPLITHNAFEHTEFISWFKPDSSSSDLSQYYRRKVLDAEFMLKCYNRIRSQVPRRTSH